MWNCCSGEGEGVDYWLTKLHKEYTNHLLPLEKASMFTSLCDPAYSLADLLAKPMILMMGQYSTGKTTFIKALLNGEEYPGMHIAAEMSTDCFTAILRGDRKDQIPGNTLVNNTEYPFNSLKGAFGENFLQRFRGSMMPEGVNGDILDEVNIIDTPGTLDGSTSERNYDYADAMAWFARRAALIIIFFDVAKMGVSTEMKSVLDNIQGNMEKIRFVFNKADSVAEMELTGAFAGLRHNLAKSMPSPEVPQVYVTSLNSLEDDYKTKNQTYIDWFSKDKRTLLEDINRVRSNTYSRKINIIDKRARMVRNHAYVMMKLREEQQKCLSLCRRQLRPKDIENLLKCLPDLYRQVQEEQNRSPDEFIAVSSVKDKLAHKDLNKLPKISSRFVESHFGKMDKTLTKYSTLQIKIE